MLPFHHFSRIKWYCKCHRRNNQCIICCNVYQKITANTCIMKLLSILLKPIQMYCQRWFVWRALWITWPRGSDAGEIKACRNCFSIALAVTEALHFTIYATLSAPNRYLLLEFSIKTYKNLKAETLFHITSRFANLAWDLHGQSESVRQSLKVCVSRQMRESWQPWYTVYICIYAYMYFSPHLFNALSIFLFLWFFQWEIFHLHVRPGAAAAAAVSHLHESLCNQFQFQAEFVFQTPSSSFNYKVRRSEKEPGVFQVAIHSPTQLNHEIIRRSNHWLNNKTLIQGKWIKVRCSRMGLGS